MFEFLFVIVAILIVLSVVQKRNKLNARMHKYSAKIYCVTEHASGLPAVNGVSVEMFYGSKVVTFVKSGQEIVLEQDKIISIDSVTSSNSLVTHIIITYRNERAIKSIKLICSGGSRSKAKQIINEFKADRSDPETTRL